MSTVAPSMASALPKPLARAYPGIRSLRPNSRVVLYTGPLELRAAKTVVRGKGTIELRWLPTSAIEFRMGKAAAQKAMALMGNAIELVVPSRAWKARAFLTWLNPEKGLLGTFTLGIGGAFRKGKSPRLREVTFHVPNVARLGNGVVREGNARWRARSIFRGGYWEFTLDQLDDSEKALGAATRAGGYAFTHAGRVKRIDGRSFSVAAAQRALKVFGLFLSFASGRWTGPLLAVGTDRNEDRVWEEWLPRRVSPPRGDTWAADFLDIGGAFPGFWTLATDPTLGTAMTSVVHWYVEANLQAGAMDGALVLLQCGFELLAWAELVVRTSTLTPAAFDGLAAKVLMTRLLTSLGIPTTLPRSLPAFRKHAPPGADGPAALTAIRNRIVHPPKTKTALQHHDTTRLIEAWRYSLWLAELCVLAMFGYRGRYHDRIRHRKKYLGTSPVPWAK